LGSGSFLPLPAPLGCWLRFFVRAVGFLQLVTLPVLPLLLPSLPRCVCTFAGLDLPRWFITFVWLPVYLGLPVSVVLQLCTVGSCGFGLVRCYVRCVTGFGSVTATVWTCLFRSLLGWLFVDLLIWLIFVCLFVRLRLVCVALILVGFRCSLPRLRSLRFCVVVRCVYVVDCCRLLLIY